MRYVIHTAKERRLAVAKLQGGFFCYYCEDMKTEKSSLIVDHIIARSQGGTEDIRNLVLSCQACNIRKSDKHADALRQQFGCETLADRIEGVKAERAHWGPDELKRALATDIDGADPGYNAYEKFIIETPTAKVINAALTYAGMSSERVRKAAGLGGWTLDRLRHERQKGTVIMWHRLSTVTGYPIQEFLKVHQRWLSPADSLQRQLEYRAAERGLDAVGLAQAIGSTPSRIRHLFSGRNCFVGDANALAIALAIPAADCLNILTTIAKTRPRPRPRPLPRPRPRPLPLPLPRAYFETFRQFVFNAHGSQRSAARALGVSEGYLTELLGGFRLPSVSICQRICDYGNLDMHGILSVLEMDALSTLAKHLPARFKDVLFPNALCYLADTTYERLGSTIGVSNAYIASIFSSASPPNWAIPPLAEALHVTESELRLSIAKRVWLNRTLPRHETQRCSNRAYVYSKFLLQASDFQNELHAAVERVGSPHVFGKQHGIHKVDRMVSPVAPRVPLTQTYLKCLKGMGIAETEYVSQTLRYEQQAIVHYGWELPSALTDVLSLPMQLFARGIEIKALSTLFAGSGFKKKHYNAWLERGTIATAWQERIGTALSLSPETVSHSVAKAQWLRTEMVLFLREGAAEEEKRRAHE